MTMDDGFAGRVAAAARSMADDGRWVPSAEACGRLLDLERFLAIRIQEGQPALEAMNARLVAAAAAAVLDAASSAMSCGAVASPSPLEIAAFGRPPAPRLVEDSLPGLFARAA